MEKPWTILWAEAEVEPNEEFLRRYEGVFKLASRVWLWWGLEETRGRAVLLGQHPLYGAVYIRPLRMGRTLEELHEDPLVKDILESKFRQFEGFYINGGEPAVEEFWRWARELGFEREFERLRDELIPVRRIHAILAHSPGVPVAYRERKAFIAGKLPIETEEEALRVAKLYGWALQKGIKLEPYGRSNGLLVFIATNAYRLFAPQVDPERPLAMVPLKGVRVEERLKRVRESGRMMGIIPRDTGEGIYAEVLNLGGLPGGVRILYHQD